MKRFRLLYLSVFSTLFTFMACQSDDTTEQGGGLQSDGTVRVHLKVGVAGSKTTRAWTDKEADTKEMMNVWTVVAVSDADNKVVSIWACKPKGEPDQEIDDYVELPAVGTYRFYSFGNMSPNVVKDLLGLNPIVVDPGSSVRTRAAGKKYDDGSTPGQTNDRNATGNVTSYVSATAGDTFYGDDNTYKPNEFHKISFDAGVMISSDAANARTVNVAGNNFDVDADNGYGAKGIPMSNAQTITVTAETTSIELIVIRMLAKIELQLFNDGNSDVTIKSFTLQDVTKNMDNNLKLLPNLTAGGANTMDYKHGDIQPNLGTAATTADLTLYPKGPEAEVKKTEHTKASGNPVTFTFYVNESAAPTNASGLFYLTLGIDMGGGTVEYRHALINQKGSTTIDNDKWDYIARNDYRKIPIVLTDWQFRIEPIAFVPIAGYPAKTLSSDALKATFSTGGVIALQPYVKKRAETTWRDFSDPEVTFESIHWKNSDGVDQAKYYSDGTDKDASAEIVKTAFAYDDVTKYIIGELSNTFPSGTHKTAITVTVKLGPTDSQYTYSFTCDVILQK